MSILAEIARRRRASALRRLGPPPAGSGERGRVAPPERDPAITRPGWSARSQLRRRVRYLRELREVQLRDLGGFVLELHRFGREQPELVRGKLESAARTDQELRQLEMALHGRVALRELRERGIGGACERCGTVYGAEDRFCSSCGEPLPGTRVPGDEGRTA